MTSDIKSALDKIEKDYFEGKDLKKLLIRYDKRKLNKE